MDRVSSTCIFAFDKVKVRSCINRYVTFDYCILRKEWSGEKASLILRKISMAIVDATDIQLLDFTEVALVLLASGLCLLKRKR